MVQENVSLYYFMTFNVKFINLQAPDSVIVQPLSIRDDQAVFIGASDQVVGQDSFQDATEGQPSRLGVSLGIVYRVLPFSLSTFEDSG